MLERLRAGLVRQLGLLVVLGIVTVIGSTAWSYLIGVGQESLPETSQAWGNEVLTGIHEHVLAALPIRLANACGLGASSCFRCHNGKRAPAPGGGAEKNPWHVQHQTVNYSCAGCHQGNPRLMKQNIAHKGLLADPRKDPATGCFGCHTSADAQSLVDAYQHVTNTKGE